MLIRTLIVDDEYLARERLKKLLEDYPEMRIVAESRNGEEALIDILNKSPHLIFLDVQMPRLNGIEVIQKLQKEGVSLPLIVFTTAYDEYALKAFDTNAIDYLLKPFEKERFKQTIEKIKEQRQLRQSHDLNNKMMKLMKSFNAASSEFRLQFIIKEKGRDFYINIEDILYLKADGNYLQLVTSGKTWLYRATMHQIENELDTRDFLRIHRSILINLQHLSGYQYLNNNEYKFKLTNGEMLLSSRSYKQAIIEHFSSNQ